MERAVSATYQPEPSGSPGDPKSHGGIRSSRPGISLLGVSSSLAILAVLAVIAIPRFFERPQVTLDNAARLIASDLAAAQNLAAYLRRTVVVVFSEHGYQAMDYESDGPRPDGSPQAESLQARIGRSYERFGVFEGVRLSDFDLGTDGHILYSPKGYIDEASSVVVQFGGERRVVRFRAPDGVAEIHDPDRP